MATTARTPPPTAAPDAGGPAPTAGLQTQQDYEAARKALAFDESCVNRIGNAPGALKGPKDAYLASAAETKRRADAGDYLGAIGSLAKLKSDVDAALAAKRGATEAATKASVKQIKDGLEAPDVGGKKVKERIGGTKWCAIVDKIVAVQLDDDFVARYDAINKDVAAALAQDPVVQEAFADWTKWAKTGASQTANAAKIKKVMEKVIEVQSKLLGLDPPTPVATYKNAADPGDCGGFNTGSKTIKLNTASADFGSFKELLDTLTHENTHAYQNKLINEYRAGTLTAGSPDYNAAMVLEMNDGDGYVSPDDETKFQAKRGATAGEPYDDQACEVHAWGAGRKAGQAAYKMIKAAAAVRAAAASSAAAGLAATGAATGTGSGP